MCSYIITVNIDTHYIYSIETNHIIVIASLPDLFQIDATTRCCGLSMILHPAF